jgi:hypothetical protein
MSSYTVLAAVSAALRQILWQSYDGDDVVRPIVGSESAVVFTNPTETARDSSFRLSLWLYHVNENEFLKNQPPQHSNGTNFQETPLALNLSYLLTPFAGTGEADLLLLGKTMQTLFDSAIFYLRLPSAEDPTQMEMQELRLILCRLSLEELTRIWEALREPYRLSVCYQARVTQIDSQRLSSKVRVLEVEDRFGGLPEVITR